MQAKQRCSVLEDQIVDLIIVAMERSEETVDDSGNADDEIYNTSCIQLWQHLSSQLIYFVLFQFSSFPHMVNALCEKVCNFMSLLVFFAPEDEILKGKKQMSKQEVVMARHDLSYALSVVTPSGA